MTIIAAPPAWRLVHQGTAANPAIRTVIEGPDNAQILFSSTIPLAVRNRLAVAVMRELEEIQCDEASFS